MRENSQKLASLGQIEHLRWMFSPLASGRDEITLKQVDSVYNSVCFEKLGCQLTAQEIHEYLSEIKPMPKSAHDEIVNMVQVA